ncbi:MAG: glycosyltransferase [Bacteroidales bacterium]|nr:glycosyltransferase [Bacteroidales bacterium]
MLLSFIVPVFNNASAFAECYVSLRPLVEAGKAEVVVVDDGSDIPPSEGRGIRLVRRPHCGAAAARNAGIEAAQGKYLWFVDADDVICTDGIECLIDDLESLPDDLQFFHIGAMMTQEDEKTPVNNHPSTINPQLTTSKSPLSLVVPHGSVTDHTTNIIRGSWLKEHPELRYPEYMSLLEDTVFCLNVVEAAERCLCNDSYHFYVRRVYHPSSTSGPWSAGRSSRFTDDICSFFTFLRNYADRHTDSTVPAFYDRMRYVYLRVVAVKGCPYSDLQRLMEIVGKPRKCPLFIYRFIAFLCRTLRPKR